MAARDAPSPLLLLVLRTGCLGILRQLLLSLERQCSSAGGFTSGLRGSRHDCQCRHNDRQCRHKMRIRQGTESETFREKVVLASEIKRTFTGQ